MLYFSQSVLSNRQRNIGITCLHETLNEWWKGKNRNIKCKNVRACLAAPVIVEEKLAEYANRFSNTFGINVMKPFMRKASLVCIAIKAITDGLRRRVWKLIVRGYLFFSHDNDRMNFAWKPIFWLALTERKLVRIFPLLVKFPRHLDFVATYFVF